MKHKTLLQNKKGWCGQMGNNLMNILKDGGDRGTTEPSVKYKFFIFFCSFPHCLFSSSLFSLHTHPALLLDLRSACLLTRDPADPSFILALCFVCVQYHYSVPEQIIYVCSSSCFGHWSNGLTGISRETIMVFTKQKRVNKERGETKAKAGGKLQRQCRGADKSVPCAAWKRNMLAYIFIYVCSCLRFAL